MSARRDRSWRHEDWGEDADLTLFRDVRRRVSRYYPEAAELPETAWAAQLLAEACNNLAKTVDRSWYSWKPRAWALARRMGALGGWSQDEYGRDVHTLYTARAGASLAHDPKGELADLLGPDEPVWPFLWSGVRRYDRAHEMIADQQALTLMQQRTATDALTSAGIGHQTRLRQRAGLPVRVEREVALPNGKRVRKRLVNLVRTR